MLRERALAPFAALTLSTLRDARRPGRLLPSLEAWSDAFAAVSAAPDGPAALEQLFRYIALVAQDLDLVQLKKYVARLAPAAEATIMTTIAEKLREEGHSQGLKEGFERGQADTLIRLMELKFGVLDGTTLRRIREADSGARERWLERVLAANELDDVLI